MESLVLLGTETKPMECLCQYVDEDGKLISLRLQRTIIQRQLELTLVWCKVRYRGVGFAI